MRNIGVFNFKFAPDIFEKQLKNHHKTGCACREAKSKPGFVKLAISWSISKTYNKNIILEWIIGDNNEDSWIQI